MKTSTDTGKPFAAGAFSAGLVLLGLALPLSLVAVEVICGLLLAIILLRFILGQKIPISYWDLPFLLFILIRLASAIFSPHPEKIGKGLTYLAFCLAYALTAWNAQGDLKQVWPRMIRGLVIGGAIASVVGLIQVAGGAERATGIYGGWTVFGSMMGAALALGVYHAAAGFLFKRRTWDVISLGIIAAGLAASICRAEWVAAILALLPAAILYYPRYSAALGAGILVLFLVIVPLRSRLSTLANPAANLSGREVLWQPVADLLAARPLLGHGLNSFHAIFPQELRPQMTDPGAGDWHNVYFQVAIESGLLGLVAFMVLLGTGLYAALQGIRRARDPSDAASAWGLFATLAFFCITGALGTFLVRISVVVLVFLLLGY
ncbi:MAG TPA: O-antigen ligase family protein, partial [bacterium]